jgi:GDPmannose 4,6-dehydratase
MYCEPKAIDKKGKEMIKKSLITGVCGQDGAYLAELLLSKGYIVHGGMRRSSNDYLARLNYLGIADSITHLNLDLSDTYNVFEVISKGQYDEVYNLAAQSSVGMSWDFALKTSNVNATGALCILDAIKRTSQHTKFYQASTSEMYGEVAENIQSELTPFHPRSPYAVSKQFAHSMAVNYRESFDIFACCGILFNHESPLRGKEFVTKKISTQLAEVKLGKRENILLGNLDAERDWGYAKEYVVGMWRMLQHEKADDYVLATGVKASIRQFVNWCSNALDINLIWEGTGLNEVGIDRETGKTVICIDANFFRPAEVDLLCGNPLKAKKKLGWSAKTQAQDLAELMVKFDYDNLKRK